MINTEFKSVIELIKAFPDEQTCINHLEQLRWSGNVVSPFDETSKVYACKGNKYRCKSTGKYFNVRTQTLFDNTKVPLQTWFLAIYLVTAHKKGISSLQLGRDLNVTQKTAWFMLQRIRNCFGITDNDSETKVGGNGNEVEIDETFVGGKNKNRHASKRTKKTMGRNAEDKSTVFGILERNGKVIVYNTPDSTRKTLQPLITKHVVKGATVCTDEYQVYKNLWVRYNHFIVNHAAGMYVMREFHTNTLEGFWSLLKRGIVGIYHYTSKKHLQKYLNEFAFRYNNREISDCNRFNLLLTNAENRLTYKQLIK